MTVKTSADRAYAIKRAEQSKMCRARKKARAMGITVEEYLDSIVPMSYEERKTRRNVQSKNSRDKKKTIVMAQLIEQAVNEGIPQTVAEEHAVTAFNKRISIAECVNANRVAGLAKAAKAKAAKVKAKAETLTA